MAKQSDDKPGRLTDALIRALPPSTKANGSTFLWDSEVKGFGVRVTRAGARAFVLNYKVGRRSRLLTIGSFPDWRTVAARDEAKVQKQRIDRGEDPMADRHAARTAPTVADLAERYIADRERWWKPSTATENGHLIRQWIIPRLGTQRVADLTRDDVEKLHAEISRAGTTVRANRALDQLRAILNKAIEWGMRGDNPAQRIERNPEHNRERYLTPDELRRLLVALDQCPNRGSVDAIRLCLLTGCRRGEALSAEWSHVDLDAGIWLRPHTLTKQKKASRIPLNAGALALLRRMRAEVGDSVYLFPGRRDNATQGDLKKTWQAVCRRAGIAGLRLHDLRHSFASYLASSGLSLPMIGALLGHADTATTARYAHLLDQPLRAATELVASIVADASVTPADRAEPQSDRNQSRSHSR